MWMCPSVAAVVVMMEAMTVVMMVEMTVVTMVVMTAVMMVVVAARRPSMANVEAVVSSAARHAPKDLPASSATVSAALTTFT